MILEADMNKREYYRCYSEIDTKNRARKHIEREDVSKKLRQIMDLVILEPKKRCKNKFRIVNDINKKAQVQTMDL